MAVFVKLKEDHYIQWSKASDSPSTNVLSRKEVEEMLDREEALSEILKNNFSKEKVIEQLDYLGTTDLGGSVDLKFILKYNSKGYRTVDDIIKDNTIEKK